MTTAGGYAGTILSVDLSNHVIEKIPLDTGLCRDFIGGHGINAKLLYDMVKPGTGPLSAENVLIFGAGPLVGTMAPTAARATAMAKSPLSGLIGINNAGHFGAMLKYAGYDHLVIKGRAESPVYLKIDEEDVRILDAKHLWGKDVYETTDTLWREIGDEHLVSCIGQAGENLVKYANILNNKHSSFSRTGLGAVMGSKKLKAVTLYGRKGVTVSYPEKFMRLVNQVLRAMNEEHGDEIEFTRKLGTASFLQQSAWLTLIKLPPPGHRDTDGRDFQKFLNEFRVGHIACPACPIGCKAWLQHKEGLEFAVSCTAGTLGMPFGVALSIPTWADIAKTSRLCQRYGMDTMNTSAMILLATELYEEGVITKEDTDGLEVRRGDSQVIQELMRRIAFREGFGDTLAETPAGACQRIGRGSEAYTQDIKGLSIPAEMGVDVRARLNHPYFLGSIVNPRGAHIDNGRCCYNLPFSGDRDTILDAVKKFAPMIGIPAQAMERILTSEGYNVALYTRFVEHFSAVVNSLGVCHRSTRALRPLERIDMLADVFWAATGTKATSSDLQLAGERIWNIQRAFNIRQGASRKDDRVPDRFLREPLESQRGTFPPAKVDEINAFLDEYYEARGWEKDTGKPTVEKLKALGLEAVAQDLLNCSA